MIAPHEFFYEATCRLLGDVHIEKAWQKCLVYINQFIPADYLSLHLFDPGLGVVETVVDATAEKSEPVSQKTILTPAARQAFQAEISKVGNEPKYTLMNQLSDFEFSRQLGLDLGTPDDPCLGMDLMAEGRYLGIAAVTNTRGIEYTHEHGRLMLMLHPPLAATAAKYHRYRELERVKDLISDKADFLRQELLKVVEDEIVGAGFGLKRVMELVEQVAPSDAPVLLLGETGVGKEVVAGSLHRGSRRASGPFIKVNCGAIPASLLEAELFGHEKGAFTGALKTRPGYFERADGGTIFLDEIAELSPEAQVRLLRVLQDKQVERVGGGQTLSLDIRVVAATHRDLQAMADEGLFRKDLLFRLNVLPINIPPLRERKEDIPPLAYHFLAKKAREMALPDLPRIADGAVDRLMSYDWPGNVRELENVIERQIIISRGALITFSDLNAAQEPAPPDPGGPVAELALDKVIGRHIISVLKLTGGRVDGKGGAAELLEVNPRTLQSRMRKMGIPFGRKHSHLYS
jgi:transcriptional regulator with GAF, ATPase, and Fis domain